MKCKKIKILLSEYIDGSLKEGKKRLIDKHLTLCNKCRDDYNKLQNYKDYAQSVKSVSPPDSLKEDTWHAILDDTAELTQNKNYSRSRHLIISWSVVAAAILLLILFIPSVYKPQSIITDFNYMPEKKGKGPADLLIHPKGSDKMIHPKRGDSMIQPKGSDPMLQPKGSDPMLAILYEMSDRFNCRISNIETNPENLVDKIELQIPWNNYNEFREVYNRLLHINPLPQLEYKRKRGFVNVQVYFPGRKFFIGDFNNDGFADYGAYFNRGRKRGEFYLALNDSTANFMKPKRAIINDSLQHIRRTDDILCGDFNNDGFDDLIIRFSDGINSGAWLIYHNNQKGGFNRGVDWNSGEKQIDNSELNNPFIGDFNGDKFDDIGTHYRRGSLQGKFVIAYNNKNNSFTHPQLFENGHTGLEQGERYTPLAIDLNGDGYSDLAIYWQSGQREAYWYFSINNKNGSGDAEFYAGFGKGHRAFQGFYIPFAGDTNNDKFDELLVKTGSSDDIGNWSVMENGRDSTFISSPYCNFNGEIDFIIR